MDNKNTTRFASAPASTPLSHNRPANNGVAGYPLFLPSEPMGHFPSHPLDYFSYSQTHANGDQNEISNVSYEIATMAPPQGFLYDTMSVPSSPQIANPPSSRLPRRRLNDSKIYPTEKYGKPGNSIRRNKRKRTSPAQSYRGNTTKTLKNQTCQNSLCSTDDCASETGSRVSECCSSCSEGQPCAEPECGKPTDVVVPCTKQSCSQPVCFDPCFPSIRQQQLPWQQGIVPSSERISSWYSTSWNPEAPRVPSPKALGDKIDPALLNAADSVHTTSKPGSPDPTTPSMGDNLETPFSPAQARPTPQFTGISSQITYPNEAAPILCGTGTMFDAGWVDNSSDYETFNCAWADCQLLFSNEKEWSYHLHQAHVDPQMTFDCPLQSDTCPPNISSHPLDHLQVTHGFNFNYSNYSCPAPDCAPENGTFCNPAMLHKHFDQAHATPATGSLYCQWNACNSTFTDQYELLNHLDVDHKLKYPTKERNLGKGSAQPDTSQYPADIPDDELSEDEDHSTCQWQVGSSLCGVVCENPKELQNHITEHHLKALNKNTGYFCQWDNCNRKKLGDKAGFSQRGKLVRHMQTHTILKEEVCDFPGCGRQFSAKQALLQHKRLHTGEKPFKCQHCDRAFAQQSACTMHERTHTGLKPLQCEHCGKRFSESSNLSKHRRMHLEEREKKGYKCDFAGCDKTFVRFASLKNHKREAHPSVDHLSRGSSLTSSEVGEDRDDHNDPSDNSTLAPSINAVSHNS